MKVQGRIPEGYVKAMEKKDEKQLNEKAYENQGKSGFAILSPDDQLSISFLKEETDKNYSKLKDIVKDMLRRQGVEVDKLEHLKDKDVDGLVIDEEAQAEAAKMIGPDGPMNAENTAERIFQFAKSISGGDTEKYDKLKEAIIGGFDAVKDMLGGELPEISQNTYDLVMEKLDDWAGIEKTDEVEEVNTTEDNDEEIVPAEESVEVDNSSDLVKDEPTTEEIPLEETTEFVLPEQEESIVTQMLDAKTEEVKEEPTFIEQMLTEDVEETE